MGGCLQVPHLFTHKVSSPTAAVRQGVTELMRLLNEVDQWTNFRIYSCGITGFRSNTLSLTGMERLLVSRNEDKLLVSTASYFGNTLLPKFSIILGKTFYPT